MILVGVYEVNTAVSALSALGMVLGGAYSLFLANRILFGNLNFKAINPSFDVTEREVATLTPLLFLVVLVGL